MQIGIGNASGAPIATPLVRAASAGLPAAFSAPARPVPWRSQLRVNASGSNLAYFLAEVNITAADTNDAPAGKTFEIRTPVAR